MCILRLPEVFEPAPRHRREAGRPQRVVRACYIGFPLPQQPMHALPPLGERGSRFGKEPRDTCDVRKVDAAIFTAERSAIDERFRTTRAAQQFDKRSRSRRSHPTILVGGWAVKCYDAIRASCTAG